MRIKFLILKYVIISSKKIENWREFKRKWWIWEEMENNQDYNKLFQKKKNPKKGKVLERA